MKTQKPLNGICPVCNNIFEHKKRGGSRKTYCSSECCRKDWIKNNPEKRKETLRKSACKPENIKRHKEYNRGYRFRKNYGLTENDVELQLHRQNYTCYGCLKKLSIGEARVDHCHNSGKFRGILCDSCNWALGFVRDSKATLRRLMTYLDYDKNKLSLYLMGALKNELRIPEIGNSLRAEGYFVMDEWITPGEHADENWQRYEKIRGRNYKEALRGIAATNIFLFDKTHIDMSDVGVLVLPCGKSAFLELGYAKGSGKKTFILLDGHEPPRYDIMPNFVDKVCFDIEELKEELKKIKINVTQQNILKE